MEATNFGLLKQMLAETNQRMNVVPDGERYLSADVQSGTGMSFPTDEDRRRVQPCHGPVRTQSDDRLQAPQHHSQIRFKQRTH